MHICIITHEYPKPGFAHGGIGSFIKTLAPKLLENNLQVTILGLSYDNTYEYVNDNGVHVYRLKYFNKRGFGWYFGAKAISDKIRDINAVNPIDIVESSELTLAFLKKINTIKYVIRLHGGHHFFAESEKRKIKFWKGFQEKRSFSKADGFIAVSNYVKTHTEKYLSYYNKPVELINYPINTELFAPLDNHILKHSIVFVGSVCEKKGIRNLIKAFPLLKKQFPEATLQIYGREWFFPNGTTFTELMQKEEISKMSTISKDIFFHGLIDYKQIPDKYSKAHVCVFPSHMETQGLVALEAMAMKKMVIFTTEGPGPETIIDYETGLLCNPYDPSDIVQKIAWVFNNQEKVAVIENNARNYVIEKYSVDKIVKKNIEFYKKIAKK